MRIRVVLEVAPKRAFASAIDWPGWSRGAKTPDGALEALLAYADRYAAVAQRARVRFARPAEADLEVVERLKGGSGTEFGVPSSVAKAEAAPLTPAERDRLLRLLRASWRAFDDAAAEAEGVTLTLGPRGGGRQLPKIVEHVREAEAAYLHQIGSKPPRGGDLAGIRRAFERALRAKADGKDLPDPNRVQKPWGPRYAIRRSAWHTLDHAWEIEDRST